MNRSAQNSMKFSSSQNHTNLNKAPSQRSLQSLAKRHRTSQCVVIIDKLVSEQLESPLKRIRHLQQIQLDKKCIVHGKKNFALMARVPYQEKSKGLDQERKFNSLIPSQLDVIKRALKEITMSEMTTKKQTTPEEIGDDNCYHGECSQKSNFSNK